MSNRKPKHSEFLTNYYFWRWQYHRRNDLVNLIGDGDDDFARNNKAPMSCFQSSLDIIVSKLKGNLDIQFPEFVESELFFRNITSTIGDNKELSIKLVLTKNIEADIRQINAYIRYEGTKDYRVIDRYITNELKLEGLLKRPTSFGTFWPRAVGLWLWDRVKELNDVHCAKKQAQKEFEQFPFFYTIPFGSELDYSFWLNRTDKCIRNDKVLTFDKKNNNNSPK